MLEQPATLRPHRAERVISAGRLLLALFLVLAIELDHPGSAPHGTLLERISLAYLVYAAALFLLTWSRATTARRMPLAAHVADLVLFSVVMHLTEGPTSPFFIYFIFAIVCGALRWHGRGALLTGAAALAAYGILALPGSDMILPRGSFDQARFITRCTQLGVLTLLLAYFGTYQRQLQTEIASLAAWPRRFPAEEAAALREGLGSAAAILRAPRIVLAWHEAEEPSLRLAMLAGDRFELARESPDAFGPLVAEPLIRSSFFCDDTAAPHPYVVTRVPGGFASWRGAPLDRSFWKRYQVGSVLALRLVAEDIDGYVFALDRRPLSVDDLLVGDIVGRFVAGVLEQQALILKGRDAAAGDERLRLARDLHDGVLQSLTAVGLQAGRLRATIARDPAEAERRLALLEDTITAEQRRLREWLDELHPGRRHAARRLDVASHVRRTVERVARHWEVRVRSSLDDLADLDPSLVQEICRMTEEALVNAVRHGGAREVHVELAEAAPNGGARLGVSYSGRGFASFSGRHDLASLTRLQVGPRTLKERVTALGGDLTIESSDTDVKLEILVGTAPRA